MSQPILRKLKAFCMLINMFKENALIVTRRLILDQYYWFSYYKNQINKSWLIVIWIVYLGYLHAIQAMYQEKVDSCLIQLQYCTYIRPQDLNFWLCIRNWIKIHQKYSTNVSTRRAGMRALAPDIWLCPAVGGCGVCCRT